MFRLFAYKESPKYKKLKTIGYIFDISLTAFILVGIIFLAIRHPKEDKPKVPEGMVEAEFVRVVDGDTIVVIYEDEETTVRLIGIDAPESVNPNPERNTPEGEEAAEFVTRLMSNTKIVYLEFDQELYDTYDRLLAYVYYYEDADLIMLNMRILKEGYAEPMIVLPNLKYAQTFVDIGKENAEDD